MFKARNVTSRFKLTLPSFALPEKWKGGRIERMANFWKAVVEDYKAVALDVVVESKQKPAKFATIVGFLGLTGYAMKTNPDEFTYIDQLTRATTELTLLSETIRNPESANLVRNLQRFKNEGLLRHFSFGIFSMMWLDNYHSDCSIYSSQCSYLKPRYLTFHERIVDVGFFGEWYFLKKGMVDYDVNEKELEKINSDVIYA